MLIKTITLIAGILTSVQTINQFDKGKYFDSLCYGFATIAICTLARLYF